MKKFFRALVDLIVGLLVLIVLAVSAVCLFPVTVIFAVLGLFYFVGTQIGWIDPKEYEKEINDEQVSNPVEDFVEEVEPEKEHVYTESTETPTPSVTPTFTPPATTTTPMPSTTPGPDSTSGYDVF